MLACAINVFVKFVDTHGLKNKLVIELIAEKSVAEILAMSNRKRHLWYKTLTPKEKANAMLIVKDITKEMSEKIESFKEWFYSRTTDGHIIYYMNGFVGVGIFETPQDHLRKGENTIWLFSVGSSEDGKDIVILTNSEMSLDEAEDKHKALGICIEKFKEG